LEIHEMYIMACKIENLDVKDVLEKEVGVEELK
jgi:hypothetical protein